MAVPKNSCEGEQEDMLPEPFNFEAKLPHFYLVCHQTGEVRRDSTLV